MRIEKPTHKYIIPQHILANGNKPSQNTASKEKKLRSTLVLQFRAHVVMYFGIVVYAPPHGIILVLLFVIFSSKYPSTAYTLRFLLFKSNSVFLTKGFVTITTMRQCKKFPNKNVAGLSHAKQV